MCPYEELENPIEQVCIREEAPFSECPISSIEVADEQHAKWMENTTVQMDYIQNLKLLYGKDTYSNPIVDHIANDALPCIAPYSFSKKKGTSGESQPNSYDKWDELAPHLQDGCPKVLTNGDQYLDKRYTEVSSKNSLFLDMNGVESDSGVLAVKIGFKFFDNAAQQRLKQNRLNFYTRGAIAF